MGSAETNIRSDEMRKLTNFPMSIVPEDRISEKTTTGSAELPVEIMAH